MRRREFLTIAGLAPATLLSQASERRPNIVYILADDLGWGDPGCYNRASDIPTPNADRLASQGMRFTDMHSPSAVCTPTRYGILTGRYAWRSRLEKGVLWGYSPSLIERGRLTVPALLKQRGYYTAGIGKWHLGLGSGEKTDYSKSFGPGPKDYGFDYYFGIPASLDMDPYVYIENNRVVEQPTESTAGSGSPRGVFWRGGPRAPSFAFENVLPTLTNRTVTVLQERARQKDKPYFLYVPLTAPHTPWLPDRKHQGKSKAGTYGDFVAQVDNSLGEILRAIDDAGHADNTLVIFTSDNGADWKEEDKGRFRHRANADWRGEKADIWEGGHRIPFIARWPGKIKAGAVSDQLGCLTDLFATVAELTGASVPAGAGEDSYSLAPTLFGQTHSKPRRAVVHHSNDGMFAIREDEWKLILGLGSGGFSIPRRVEPTPGGPEGQLYNLRNDPAESTNLWTKHPEIVSRLRRLLERYQKEGRSAPASTG